MKRIRVLIVDDSSSARQVVSAVVAREPDLEIAGHASDGVEAVALARSLRPDVVLMDFNMPKMDGLAATARIMEEAPSRVLLLTALGNARELNLAYGAIAAGDLEQLKLPDGGGRDELVLDKRDQVGVVDGLLLVAERLEAFEGREQGLLVELQAQFLQPRAEGVLARVLAQHQQ